ncbi:hypothetical protein ACFU9X_46805 [Streptomyces atratus]|uniref:hypothetical protein n=1 Tax=Streptomyces atratus TaxID=1893 RepID=UPI00367A47EB
MATDAGFSGAFLSAIPDGAGFAQDLDRNARGFAELTRRAKESDRLRADFAPGDLRRSLMANAVIVANSPDTASAASRRLVALLLQCLRAHPAAPPEPLPPVLSRLSLAPPEDRNRRSAPQAPTSRPLQRRSSACGSDHCRSGGGRAVRPLPQGSSPASKASRRDTACEPGPDQVGGVLAVGDMVRCTVPRTTALAGPARSGVDDTELTREWAESGQPEGAAYCPACDEILSVPPDENVVTIRTLVAFNS